MPAPFNAPPLGLLWGRILSRESSWWQWGEERRTSWGEISFNAVLFKIHLKSGQQAAVGSWGPEEIPSWLFQLPPLPRIWEGQGVAECNIPLMGSVTCKSHLFPIILHIRNGSSWERAKSRPPWGCYKFRVILFASVGLFALCLCETM